MINEDSKKAGIVMVSIAVCDDRIPECGQIAQEIQSILEEMQVPCILRQFNSGRELLQAAEQFDILFLDILMPGLDGMETAELLRKKAFDKILIFLSVSREYVFDAYEVEAFWYLLKPVDHKKLKRVLQRALQKVRQPSQGFLLVSNDRQRSKLSLEKVLYFEVRGRVVYAHGMEGVCDFYERIGVLEENLKGKGFFRCHKSFLVNLNCVKSYNRQEVVLDNGEKVAIAKRRYEAFCAEMLEYMRQNGGIV